MPGFLPLPCDERRYTFGETSFKAFIPDPAALHERFSAGMQAPYWARIWPAAIGLCGFLAEHPTLLKGRRVLELAAGLGLPGLFASNVAQHVTLSDIDADAVSIMNASVEANAFSNVDCRIIDWAKIPADLRPELVLLSDVNYEPAVFEVLYTALNALHVQGVPILLSTPQRLVAKSFIERLSPMIRERHEVEVQGAFVSIFLL